MLWVFIRRASAKGLLISTHNVCFPQEIKTKYRHFNVEKSALSRAGGVYLKY